jgi:hypothetical protein
LKNQFWILTGVSSLQVLGLYIGPVSDAKILQDTSVNISDQEKNKMEEVNFTIGIQFMKCSTGKVYRNEITRRENYHLRKLEKREGYGVKKWLQNKISAGHTFA